MKYLKLFEDLKLIDSKDMEYWGNGEQPDPLIDRVYFDQVFADFLDKGATSDVEYGNYDDEDNELDIIYRYKLSIEYEIFFKEKSIRSDIDKFTKYVDNLNEMSLDLKSCLGKIKEDYPNILNMIYTIESANIYIITLYYPHNYFRYHENNFK